MDIMNYNIVISISLNYLPKIVSTIDGIKCLFPLLKAATISNTLTTPSLFSSPSITLRT